MVAMVADVAGVQNETAGQRLLDLKTPLDHGRKAQVAAERARRDGVVRRFGIERVCRETQARKAGARKTETLREVVAGSVQIAQLALAPVHSRTHADHGLSVQ